MKYGPTIFATDDAMPSPDLASEAGADTPLPMFDRLAMFAVETH